MNYDIASVIVENRADPHILKQSGHYYFTATVPEYNKIILRSADTLKGLSSAHEVVIWTPKEGSEMSCYIWAPEIHYINGAWYIYFAAKNNKSLDHTKNAHKMYVLECKDKNPLMGTWSELGQVKTNWESFSLDATTFEHCGIRYLVWAQMDVRIPGNSNIYIAKMKSPHEIEGKQIMLSCPQLPWEIIGFKVNEGPSIIKLNGKIILSYSGSATDSNYAIGILVANENSDLLAKESWKKFDEPIRSTNKDINEFGPGHNCFTYSEDGVTPLLIYHARDYEEVIGDPLLDINRHTKVVKLDLEDI